MRLGALLLLLLMAASCGGPWQRQRPTTAPADPAPELSADALRELGDERMYRALDPAGATSAYERLRALTPADASVHATLAMLYADARRFDQAMQAADARVQLEPRQAAALDGRAEVLLLRGDLDTAAAGFREALTIERGSVEARMGLAAVLGYRGQWEAAGAELAQALEAARGEEDRRRLQTALGWAQLAAGQAARARETLLQAYAASPRRTQLLSIELAIELEQWRQASQEAAALGQSLEGAAADDEGARHLLRWVRMLRAMAASRAGELAAAEREVLELERDAASLDPWITKDATMARGHLAMARGETDAAVAAFTDRWVMNHASLYDPRRGEPGASYDSFALQGRLLAAEALVRGGRSLEARHLLDQLATTYHRGLGAVRIHERAKRMRAELGGNDGAESRR